MLKIMLNNYRTMLNCQAIATIPILFLLFLSACNNPASHSSNSIPSSQPTPTLDESTQIATSTPTIKTTYPKSYPLKLLTTGSFHGENVPAKTSGEQWLGLFSTSNGFELLPTKITVNYFHDPLVDGDKTIKTGKKITTNEKVQPIFLVNGSILLKPGIVKTVFSGKVKLVPKNQPFYFYPNSESGDVYRISIEERSDRKTKYYLILALLNDMVAQEISSCCVERYPELLWAGDLDRDGKLDLLVDLSDRYYASIPTLFLSSFKKQNPIVEPVAQFTISSC